MGHRLSTDKTICHRLAAKTIFDFGKTGNSVSKRRLKSNRTVMVKKWDMWRKRLQKMR